MPFAHSELVYELFTEARRLPPERREIYLRSACEKRPELLSAVHKLVAAEEHALPFLGDDGSPDESTLLPPREQTHITPPEAPRLLEIVGPYRLIDVLGEGGMGVVYLAEQTRPIRRRVALKVIRPGLNSRQFVARFEAERQALALMEHPNIARVFDAGTTAAGLPYFVMELVTGLPMNQFCDEKRIDIRGRLKLFIDVCLAIQHAHTKGLIHRDIKPSNILVTVTDDQPDIKIIDFGVAKALTGNLTDATMYTGLFQMIGTPLYTSPEQASMSGDVDTRSDVYALGTVLYELLTGVLPIDRSEAKQLPFDELLQCIRLTDAPRPSKRLGKLDSSLPEIAERRQLETDELRGLFVRELDWIVLKALEKDRDRRYQSPRELADDIRRYLDSRPVRACERTSTYLLRKAIRRHRASIAAASLVLLAMIVGTSVAVVQAVRATQAERQAQTSRAEAERHAESLSEMLYSSDMLTATQRFLDGDAAQMQGLLNRYQPRRADMRDLRGYEWYLLNAQKPVLTRTVFQSPHRLDGLALSADGQLLAVGDSNGIISVMDTVEWQILSEFPSGHEEVFDLCFLSSDQFASCGHDGSVAIWDVLRSTQEARPNAGLGAASEGATGPFARTQPVAAWKSASVSVDTIPASEASGFESVVLHRRIECSESPLFAIAFGPQQSQLYVGGQDKFLYRIDPATGAFQHNPLRIADELAGQRIDSLAAIPAGVVVGTHAGRTLFVGYDSREITNPIEQTAGMHGVRDQQYQPNSELLVAGQLGGLVTVMETQPELRIRLRQLFPSSADSATISSDGQWIAAGDATGFIHLIPVAAGHEYLNDEFARRRRMRSWKVHDRNVERLVFLPDSSAVQSPALLSCSRDGRVVVSQPFESQSVLTSRRLCRAMEFLDSNTMLLAADSLARVDVNHRLKELDETGGGVRWTGIRATDDGTVFLCHDHREIVRGTVGKLSQDVSGHEPLWRAEPNETIPRWTISPDGGHFAVCVESQRPRRHRIELFLTGQTESYASLPSNLTNAMDYSPDGSVLAFVRNNDVEMIDVSTAKRMHTLRGHGASVRDLSFNPNGSLLVSVSDDRTLKCWDTTSGKLLWSEVAHENKAVAVTFHPFLSTLATAGADAVLRFWRTDHNMGGSRLVGEFPLAVGRIGELAFSPDGRNLAVRHAQLQLSVLKASPIDTR